MAVATPLMAADEEEGFGATYARVRYLEGRVTIVSASEEREAEATTNTPIGPADRLQAQDGRAEIELADGSLLWIDGNTRLDLRTLADINNRYEKSNLLALPTGTMRLQAADPDSKDKVFRIDTPHGSVYLLSGGSFRVDSRDDETTVSSFRGVAELSGDDGSVLVRSGETSRVDRYGTPSEPRSFNTLRTDDFDRFCETRQAAYTRREDDQQEAGGSPAPDDLPYEVQPYSRELSYYGGWYSVPSYGWVWRPTYYGSWGPYVNGYWSWYPTGWSWVSYDPWGWAPYHYGRWDVVAGIGWAWIPGSVWSGAWVSFAVGPSYIGWCPLNYYNYPVYHHGDFDHGGHVDSAHLRGRGWHFLPADRFSDRRGGRSVVPADRLPRDSDFVVSGRLPRFEPKELTGRPERGRQLVETVRQKRVPLPVVSGEGGKPAPFRSAEEKGRTVSRRQAGTGSPSGEGNRGGTSPGVTTRKQSTAGRPQPEGASRNPRSGNAAAPRASQPNPRSPQRTEPRSQPRERGSVQSNPPQKEQPQGGSQRSDRSGARPERLSLNQAPGPRAWSQSRGGVVAGGRLQSNSAARPMPQRPERSGAWAPHDSRRGGPMALPNARLRPPAPGQVSRPPDRVVDRIFQGVRRETSMQRTAPGYGGQPAVGASRPAPTRPAPVQPQGQTGRSRPDRH